ncbi:Dps family protein [Hirschia baltica]|uniref:Ferritin Dps family protein n=1 Tax=Hirschia baltica (strain ATCC 49814 / DSM 5838 / IFAM 1418) TaxID=582402 RepID=C6XLC0_HIRBI|nr:DNA starvation/stationary phase protection protein [Hirschia baltica]ACT59719.1 Ferritin Dps family protein [Hirschia baltica ATCC 49814]
MTNTVLKVANSEFDRNTGISDENREKLAEALGVVLSDTFMLFIKTQGVHWNVTGPAFVSIHELTEAQYGNLYEAIDEIAERIRALGFKAPASYAKYGELSAIESEDENKSADEMLEMLARDHETTITNMRAAIEWCEGKKDYVTADMIIARMAWHEQAVWMLKSIRQS